MSWAFGIASALRMVLRHAGGAIGWLLEKPLRAATIALGLWLAWLLLVTVPALVRDRNQAAAARSAEWQAHQQTKANYAAAQLIAAEAARQQKQRAEAHYKELAEHADTRFEQGRAAALSAAARHAAAHRLPVGTGTAIAAGPSGAATASAPDHTTGSSDGTGGAPQLVAVTEADLQICTINTARLLEVRAWATGLAVAAE